MPSLSLAFWLIVLVSVQLCHLWQRKYPHVEVLLISVFVVYGCIYYCLVEYTIMIWFWIQWDCMMVCNMWNDQFTTCWMVIQWYFIIFDNCLFYLNKLFTRNIIIIPYISILHKHKCNCLSMFWNVVWVIIVSSTALLVSSSTEKGGENNKNIPLLQLLWDMFLTLSDTFIVGNKLLLDFQEMLWSILSCAWSSKWL